MAFGHGLGKVDRFFKGIEAGTFTFADPLGLGPGLSLFLAAFSEFVCPMALILGAATRFFCVPLICTMAVAVFIVHGIDPFAKKELALLYLSGTLSIFLVGPGRFSLDRLFS